MQRERSKSFLLLAFILIGPVLAISENTLPSPAAPYAPAVADAARLAGRQRIPNKAISDMATLKTTRESAANAVRLNERYGEIPLSFEENKGNYDSEVRYVSRGSNFGLFFAPNEINLKLSKREEHRAMENGPESKAIADNSSVQFAAVRTTFPGSNQDPAIVGLDKQEKLSHYLIGNDQSKWRKNIPNYARVKYSELYQGIDLIYYGNQRQLEYDFIVEPKADPTRIRLAFRGIEKLRIDDLGNLVLTTAVGDLIQHRPVAYQHSQTKRLPVDSAWEIHGQFQVGFRLGQYDTSSELVIDPVLSYSSYSGGSAFEEGYSIAVDSSGNAYITGYTESTDFTTVGPVQASNAGASDAFITKINPLGNSIVYSTYLGGSNYDYAYSISVDGSDSAYVAGWTASTDFPTANPIQATNTGSYDAFVAKLNPAGNALVYSTYLGGSSNDYAFAVAVDSSDAAYITGHTTSTNFPTAPALPLQGSNAGLQDAFITKINNTGTALVYSTYLGGTNLDVAYSLALDSSNNAYVTGYTDSTNFPTANAYQAVKSLSYDVFITKLNATGIALIYSTYLGGSSSELALAIAVDNSDSAYITGRTTSTNFPTHNPFQAALAGGMDAFVTKLNNTGGALTYSTYLGGALPDFGDSIALDSAGNAYIAGFTDSTNFPTANPIQGSNAGGSDAFITKINAVGGGIPFSTYLGGIDHDSAFGIAVDSSDNVYVTGYTESLNFPTENAYQSGLGGGFDAFVAKLAPSLCASPIPWQIGVPGPLSPNLEQTEWWAGTTTNQGDFVADVPNICDGGPGNIARDASSIPGYLYNIGTSGLSNLSRKPTPANSITFNFTVSVDTGGACTHFRRFGSEDGQVTLRDGNSQIVFQDVTNGNGETVPLTYERENIGTLSVGDYSLTLLYQGAGSDNGFFPDLIAMFDSDACGAISGSSLASEAVQVGGLNRFSRYKFAQIGQIDRYSADPSTYYDEFLSGISWTEDFSYNVASNSDDEINAPAVPAFVSAAAVSGQAATKQLRLQYQAAESFPDGAVVTLLWYGDTSTRVKVYNDGTYLMTAKLNHGSSHVQTNVLVKNLQAGTHELKLVAESGEMALDAIYLIDQRTDMDRDGLSDADELAAGTNPGKADSDGDGVDDWLEIAMGSDPLDSQSFLSSQGQNFTTGRNSFLGMINIQEIRNVSDVTQSVWLEMDDMQGELQDRRRLDLPAKGQFDVLVHSLSGYLPDTIGSLLVSHAANPGDIQTQIVYYKPSQTSERAYDFAFANASQALAGVQQVPVNTFYPNFGGFNPTGVSHNWLEISHVELTESATASHNGILDIYNAAGEKVRSVEIRLESGGRRDVDAHSILGPSQVGFAIWRPADGDSYTLKNSRYYFNGQLGRYISAFQLGAQQGSTQALFLPIDTEGVVTILEIGSAVAEDNSVQIDFYSKTGTFIASKQLQLKDYATDHTIANEYPALIAAGLGLAVVNSARPVIATSMQYDVDNFSNVTAVSGVPGNEALARIVDSHYQQNASYNTFLNQDCSFVVLNPNSTTINPVITLYKLDGEEFFSTVLSIKGKGAVKWNACAYAAKDTYGSIELTLERNPLGVKPPVSWLYRKGDVYRFPTNVQ